MNAAEVSDRNNRTASSKETGKGEDDMKCPQCSHEIRDGSKFCTNCGRPVDAADPFSNNRNTERKQKSRKTITILALIGLAAVVAVSAFFFFRRPDQREYQETMAEAERYLYDLDFDKAEECYLKARRIEPKKAAPYTGLYQVYLQKDEPEKAETLLAEAGESLDETQFEKLQESAKEVRSDLKNTEINYVTAYEIGELDRAPINVGNSGWIIERNGKYGLLDSKGKVVADPNGTAFSFYESSDENKEDKKAYACVFESVYEDASASIHGSDFTENDCFQLDGITVPKGVITLDRNDKLQVQTAEKTESCSGKSTGSSEEPVLVLKEITADHSDVLDDVYKAFENREFYIYSQKNQKPYGPFTADEIPAFSKLKLNSDQFDIVRGLSDQDSGFGRDLQFFSEPFWVRDEDGYTVFSNDESKSLSGFSQAEIISPNAVGVFKNGLFHLLDENLNELYVGHFESGARGIDGLTPVKTDGTWKLVKFEKVVQAEKEAKERKEKEEKERKEKEEQERKQREEEERRKKEEQEAARAADFSDLAGKYTWASGAGAWACELTVNPDGTFAAKYHDTDMGVTGPGYPKGSVSIANFSGKLNRASDRELQMNQIVLDNPAGTSEIIDEMKHDYTSNDSLGLSEGSNLTIYPAGTPLSSLPEAEQFQVKNVFSSVIDGTVLLSPMLSNGQAIFVQW